MVTGDREPTLVESIANGAGQVAKLATAVMPIISAINTEQKYFDATAAVTAYQPGTNDQIIGLTGAMAQGVTDVTRIGNSVLAKDIQVRLAIDFPQTIGPPAVTGLHCRMMLLCWKENVQLNGPTAAKIFESPTNLYSPVNKDYSDQFVVMKDKFFVLRGDGYTAATQAGQTCMKLYKKLDWHMRWQGGTINDATTNHIILVLRSSSAGVTNAMNVTYYSRLNFTDN